MENNNLKLIFGSNKVEIILNDATDAKWIAITEGWESKTYARALVAIMTGYYPVSRLGVYLHKSLEEILASPDKDDNCGYALGKMLKEMIEAKEVSYTKAEEIVDGDTYRIRFDGLFAIYASHVPYVDRIEGEYDYVAHNRAAILLVRTLAKIERARLLGRNIRLVYNNDDAVFFTHPEKGFAHKYELFMNGDMEAFNSILNAQIAEKKTYQTLRAFEAREKKATEEGKELPARKLGEWKPMDVLGNVVTEADLVGQVIQFVLGNTTLVKQWIVTEDTNDVSAGLISAESAIHTTHARRAKIMFVGNPAPAEKPRKSGSKRRINVPVAVS